MSESHKISDKLGPSDLFSELDSEVDTSKNLLRILKYDRNELLDYLMTSS